MSAAGEQALTVARAALGGTPAWLVGGAVRDRELGRESADLDVIVEGDPAEAAGALAHAAKRAGIAVARFALSDEFGAWRVMARGGAWQIDLERLRGASLEEDLRLRDFTVNAVAEPLEGGRPVDPLGGLGDLRAGRLRMAGSGAFADDPLRVLRLVRMSAELGLRAQTGTCAAAAAQTHALRRISPERVFVELHRTLSSAQAVSGVEMLRELGALAVVLPELDATRGVEQSRYHHRDVYGHTLEVLERTIELQSDSGMPLGSEHAQAVSRLLSEPLADGLTRGQALRWGALLHDAAKPLTRSVRPGDGRVTFMGHDSEGAQLAKDVLARLRTSTRLREHVSALVRHHLRLGFLVHAPQPLAAETVYDYLRATEPVEVDVTLLSVADRLATRGGDPNESIAAHLALARQMLGHALRWRAEGPPKPLVRGDELAAELQIDAGPRLGELLEGLSRAQYSGQVRTRAQAIAFARGGGGR